MWPFGPAYPELTPQEVGVRVPFSSSDDLASTYDYIIVGGGTAGCVLASRLSEVPDIKVLLIERGNVSDDLASRNPTISSNMHRKGAQSLIWPAKLNPELNNGRRIRVICGEGMGGTTRLNGMIYTRGSCSDYNNWRDMGHPDWSYKALQPYFAKSETSINQPPSSFRGKSGPWKNQCFHDKIPHEIVRLAAEVSPELGIPVVSDLNSPKAPANGCGHLDETINERMERCSIYHAFLPKQLALERKPRLKICTNTIVTRLDIDKDEKGGLKVLGVYFESRNVKSNQETFYAKAKREVILCCGAFGSPQLLHLSGIGPSQHLKDMGIAVIHDLPGVGSNLQDHFGLAVQFSNPLSDSFHAVVYRGSQSLHIKLYVIFRIIREVLQYALFRSGLLAFGVTFISIFVRSELFSEKGEILPNVTPADVDPNLPANIPDIELLLLAFSGATVCPDVDTGIFCFYTELVKPKSVGSVRLASKDPRARPEVDLGYLTNVEDYIPLRKGVRLALRYGEKIAAKGYPLKPLQIPETENDKDVDDFIRKGAKTSYHYTGTCRMGRLDEARPGVVDDELKVHGIHGLRICDASVFPEIIATHTMAPTVVVAEKCADIIKKSANAVSN